MKPLENIEVVGGHPAVDFVNTVHSWQAEPPPDYLRGFDDFLDWSLMTGVLPPTSAARFKAAPEREKTRAFDKVRELRRNLHGLFAALAAGDALSQKALDHLNGIIRRTAVWRRLTADHDTGSTTVCFAWEFADAPLTAALGPVAWLAADLLENGQIERLKECAGENCGWLFIDASKNRSRNWCSMKTCGNAAKVKRFRQRAR